MATSNQLPSWLIEYIQEARDLFSIGGAEWSIYTKLTDKPAGNSGNSGSATKDWRYLNATLEFSTELEEGGQARETAIHEVGHVAFFEIDSAVDGILAQVPDDRREFMRELYVDAQERFLQRLSRAFVNQYRVRGKDEGQQ